jgi:hypothetical protein
MKLDHYGFAYSLQINLSSQSSLILHTFLCIGNESPLHEVAQYINFTFMHHELDIFRLVPQQSWHSLPSLDEAMLRVNPVFANSQWGQSPPSHDDTVRLHVNPAIRCAAARWELARAHLSEVN